MTTKGLRRMTPDSSSNADASRRMAEAVFADPILREKFERMIREMAERDPVPDDFEWLK